MRQIGEFLLHFFDYVQLLLIAPIGMEFQQLSISYTEAGGRYFSTSKQALIFSEN
jgi:hypothetical protein